MTTHCTAMTKCGKVCKNRGYPMCAFHQKHMNKSDPLCGCKEKSPVVKGGLASFAWHKLDNLQGDYLKGLANYGVDIAKTARDVTKPIAQTAKSLGLIPNDPRAQVAYNLIYGDGVKKAPKVCYKGYEMIGMKSKGGRKVPNCVPVKGKGFAEDYAKEINKLEQLKQFSPEEQKKISEQMALHRKEKPLNFFNVDMSGAMPQSFSYGSTGAGLGKKKALRGAGKRSLILGGEIVDKDVRAAGIGSVLKKVGRFVKSIPYRVKAVYQFGPRGNEPTGRFEHYLEKNKDKKITSIDVGRTPLSGGVSKAMNLLSGGRFSKKSKELGYDDVYHQYMIVNYADGTSEKIEKNHVVENSKPSADDIKNIKVTIPAGDKNLNIKDLMKNASYEDDTFWKYDPAKKNCQIFVRNVVDRNGLLPQIDTSQVLETQEAHKLVDTIPYPLRNIPLVVTNLASATDKIIYGKGLKENEVLKARLIVNGMI